MGWLGLVNVESKATALLIKSFLETAINSNFLKSEYHEALYFWYVEERRDIVQPIQPPYYNNEFFAIIKKKQKIKVYWTSVLCQLACGIGYF